MAQLHQEQLADFILVRTDEIDAGDRLRAVDQVWASALGAMMARDGQQTPIQVCRLPGRDRWTLVVGAHRHSGALAAEIEYLKAEVVSADRDSRRLREIVENLHRRDLDPLDRAAFMAELVALKRASAGLAAASRDGKVNQRWKQALTEEADTMLETISSSYGWTDEIGEQLGFTGRTIRNDLMLYRRLAPSIGARLRAERHPILANATQLRALAKLDGDAQEAAADRLIAGAKSVAEATRPVGSNRPAEPEAKRLSAFIGAFSRMGVAEKKAALFQLTGMLPPGTTLTNMEQRPAKPTYPAEHVAYREEALEAIDTMRELVEALLEDEVIPIDRSSDLERANGQLRLTRVTIAGNGFELGAAA